MSGKEKDEGQKNMRMISAFRSPRTAVCACMRACVGREGEGGERVFLRGA